MFRSIVLLVGGLASLCASSLFAQDAVLGQKYGLGVHAYFAGEYPKAHEQLTAAIDGGSKDPRAFYFRGLAYLRLGRAQDANVDFQKGADLESRDVNKFYNVAKSLERVQGADRVALENYRINARMAALEQAEKMRKARYEAIQRDEQRVLREQALVPTPPEPAKGAAAAQPATDVDLFAAPEDKAAPAAEKKAAAPPKAGKKATAAEPAEKPAKAEAREKKPAEVPAAPTADDPFAVKPAGKAEPAKPAAEEKPAADEKKPAEKKAYPADPFAS
jgi:hypothetical protein